MDIGDIDVADSQREWRQARRERDQASRRERDKQAAGLPDREGAGGQAPFTRPLLGQRKRIPAVIDTSAVKPATIFCNAASP